MTDIAVNAFEIFAKVVLNNDDYKKKLDESESKISKFAGSLKNGLTTAAKIGGAALGVAATAVSALTKASIENYAEYEQLVGGAELMFGKAYDKVAQNAKNAYKTVQMSQNEYLQQVNGFATGLKTALKGNETAAADLAHKIVQAEADIVAATGESQENIQNAFNGIMKSNFTMLDNLKLGITPTKEGFQEVIDKVNAWNKTNGEATNYQMGNLADMQSALVDYVEMVGMKGYAEKEAAKTIQGSLSSTKAAYSNLITGLADDNANFDELVNNLVTSIAGDGTEANPGLIGNIMPRIETALGGIGTLITKLAPVIGEQLPVLVTTLLPMVIESAMNLFTALFKALPGMMDSLSGTILVLSEKVTGILQKGLVDGDSLSKFMDSALILISSLGKFLLDNAPLLIKTAVNVVVKLAEWLGGNSETITDSAIELILALAIGLMGSLPELLPTVVKIITGIVDALLSQENRDSLGDAAIEIGTAIIHGIWEAIKSLGSWFSGKIKGWFSNTMDDVKADQEIHSPSKLWERIIGKPIGQGVGEGAVKGLDESKKKIKFKFNEMSEEVLEKVEKLAKKIKDKLSEIQGFFDATSDIAELEYELWEMTEGLDASETEKTAKRLEMLNQQLSDQKQIVDANAEAYAEMVKLYGEGSVQAMEYKKALLEEQVEFQKLQTEVNETNKTYDDLTEKQKTWASVAIDAVRSVARAIKESTKESNTSVAEQQRKNEEGLNDSIAELINLFKTGKAKTNVANARELRGVSYG